MTFHFDLASQVASVGSSFWSSLSKNTSRSEKQLAHLKALHNAQFERAVARYRRVLHGRGWCSTSQIEEFLGMAETTCNSFLRKLLAKGYIERRNRYGEEKYNKNRGWEYKWKQ